MDNQQEDILLVGPVSSYSEMDGLLTSDHALNDEHSSLGESLEDDGMSGAYLDSGPPPTPRELDHWNYHISLQQFGKESRIFKLRHKQCFQMKLGQYTLTSLC
jgi:hypothetical protein